MPPSPARSPWLVLAALLSVLVCPMVGRADEAPRKLGCAVDGLARLARSGELCRSVGRELTRSVVLVEDARKVARGESVHIIHDDVQWFVVWLVDGRVRAWTRVSKTEGMDDQLRLIGRAARALAKQVVEPERACVRLDPNGGRRMRSPDLTYPWAELRPCGRRLVEVVDPWWLPARVSS